ncbi:DUF4157 domain-containing protein [Roseivirga sp. BDSF3-8]|uniref:eCIS core domain-containing protein n=1 Tax=Roseivirga sp. BDSF3-8 TaxID=3241598 RepID=UPI0035319A98
MKDSSHVNRQANPQAPKAIQPAQRKSSQAGSIKAPHFTEVKTTAESENTAQLQAIARAFAPTGPPPLPPDASPAQRQAASTTGGGSGLPGSGLPGSGLPGQLKNGIENLSGYSMDDVRVHYNSSKLAQLKAHAYAQGNDIHMAPGQEKHLPHEAWHVVQQKQGRVKATKQLKGQTLVNDDAGLEHEADVMGAKALQFAGTGAGISRGTGKGSKSPGTIQRKPDPEEESLHDTIKQASGKNTIKWPIKKVPLGQHFELEGAVTLAIDTGRTPSTETGFKGPEMKGPDGLGTEINAKKKEMVGKIKAGALNFISGNTQLSSSDEFGNFYLGFSLGTDFASTSLSGTKQETKLAGAKLRGIGRWDYKPGVRVDVYLEGSLSVTAAVSQEILEKALKRAANAPKVRKGRALQKAMTEALEAEQRLVARQLAEMQRKPSQKAVEAFIKDALTREKDEAVKMLRRVHGIGQGKASRIYDHFSKSKNSFRKLDDLRRVPKIKHSTVIRQFKNATSLADPAEVRALQRKAASITDDLAKIGSKTALEVFEKEAAEKAGKRTVAKVASKVAAKLGLKVAARVALKFIPFVNIVMLAWDIYEIGSLIYNVWNSKDMPPGQGGSGSSSSENSSSGTGDTGDAETGQQAEPHEKGSENASGNGPVGISKTMVDKLAAPPPNVQALWAELTKEGSPGTLTDAHLQKFLDTIPPNISEQEVADIVSFIKKKGASTPEELLTALEYAVHQTKETLTDSEDGKSAPPADPSGGKEHAELPKGPAGNGQETAHEREWDGIHKRINASEAVFDGAAGSGKSGTVSIANISMAHTKGAQVNLTLVGWDITGTNSVSVLNVPAIVTKRLYFNQNSGRTTNSRASATGMKIFYQITQGVKFDWPGDRDGVLPQNREIWGYFSF